MESVLILVGVLVGLIILVRSIGKYAYIGGKGEADAENNAHNVNVLNRVMSKLQGKVPNVSDIANRWRNRM